MLVVRIFSFTELSCAIRGNLVNHLGILPTFQFVKRLPSVPMSAFMFSFFKSFLMVDRDDFLEEIFRL